MYCTEREAGNRREHIEKKKNHNDCMQPLLRPVALSCQSVAVIIVVRDVCLSVWLGRDGGGEEVKEEGWAAYWHCWVEYVLYHANIRHLYLRLMVSPSVVGAGSVGEDE